jgi:1,4-dihydroxy-6-naphthoate synthase
MKRLRVGLSTCPNDTYAFCALLERELAPQGIELAFTLGDVEQLNQALLRGELDVSKASFALWLDAPERFALLPYGSALGFGVGPLLLGGRKPLQAGATGLTLCPGRHTTAYLLLRLFHGAEPPPGQTREHVPFFEIPASLAQGRAERGLCIHEARFTWRQWGVEWMEDLGATWERETGLPLPLGGILARRDLPEPDLHAFSLALAGSLAWADAQPQRTLPTMRRLAQETSDSILWDHVRTYVTDETRGSSVRAERALRELARRGAQVGVGRAAQADLEILDAATGRWRALAGP